MSSWPFLFIPCAIVHITFVFIIRESFFFRTWSDETSFSPVGVQTVLRSVRRENEDEEVVAHIQHVASSRGLLIGTYLTFEVGLVFVRIDHYSLHLFIYIMFERKGQYLFAILFFYIRNL